MFHIALYEPEIPPNTGNIIRLCANTGTCLHLIHPLGFGMDDRQLQRAGLDYHDLATVREHAGYPEFLQAVTPGRLFAVSTRGRQVYSDTRYQDGDAFLLGPETRGLPRGLLDSLPAGRVLCIPMQAGSRSLNLSNAAAIVLYEALRQLQFPFPD